MGRSVLPAARHRDRITRVRHLHGAVDGLAAEWIRTLLPLAFAVRKI